MKNFVLSLLVVFILSLLALGQAWGSSYHVVFMYKNENIQSPSTLFSPKDKIVVRIKIKDLPKGSYTFHADWYNANGNLQEKCSYQFSTSSQTDKVLESYLEIIKASRLKRMFSTSEATGYNIKFYGRWKVKLYLNGEEIAYKEFEIQ